MCCLAFCCCCRLSPQLSLAGRERKNTTVKISPVLYCGCPPKARALAAGVLPAAHKAQLAPGLVEHNGNGIGEIDATTHGLHGNAEDVLGGETVENMGR